MSIGKTPRKGRSKRVPRKPHNVHVPSFGTILELFEAVGAEQRRLKTTTGEAVMSRKERIYRLMIDRALRGEQRDLAHLARLMIKYPDIAIDLGQIHMIVNGPMAHV